MEKQTPYGKITLESLKEVVEHVFSQERNKPKKEREIKILRGCSTYGFIKGFDHCGSELCYSCNYYADLLQKEFKNEFYKMIIEYWQKKLGLERYTINLEEISREQVTFPKDISDKDRYFIGISLKENVATISYDRDMTQEDILHELLHLAFPDKSEDWINEETNIRLNENKSKNS